MDLTRRWPSVTSVLEQQTNCYIDFVRGPQNFAGEWPRCTPDAPANDFRLPNQQPSCLSYKTVGDGAEIHRSDPSLTRLVSDVLARDYRLMIYALNSFFFDPGSVPIYFAIDAMLRWSAQASVRCESAKRAPTLRSCSIHHRRLGGQFVTTWRH